MSWALVFSLGFEIICLKWEFLLKWEFFLRKNTEIPLFCQQTKRANIMMRWLVCASESQVWDQWPWLLSLRQQNFPQNSLSLSTQVQKWILALTHKQPLPMFLTINKVTKLLATFCQALRSYDKHEKWPKFLYCCFNSLPPWTSHFPITIYLQV